MLYGVPTKRGLGIELWGTYEDMKTLYEVIGKFWNDEPFGKDKAFENRDSLISGFSYEIRHCYQGDRLKGDHSHFTFDLIPHFGCQLSWVHIIFTLASLRANLAFFPATKLDLGLLLQLEYWIEQSLISFDHEGGSALVPFLNGSVYSGNPLIYQFMRSINMEYFLLGGGKPAFRKLSQLMRRSIFGTDEYRKLETQLERDGKANGCDPSELDYNEDDKIYEIVW